VKKFLSQLIAIVFLLQIFNPAAVAVRAAEQDYVKKLLYFNDYQKYKAGQKIFTNGNYNIEAEVDPTDEKNMTARQLFSDKATSGFVDSVALDIQETSSGTLIMEMDVMINSVKGSGVSQIMYMRCNNNNVLTLWTISPGGIGQVSPEFNQWYKMVKILNLDESTVDTLVLDNNGKILFEAKGAGMPKNIDTSIGFKNFYLRYMGSPGGENKIYVDNLKVYKADKEMFLLETEKNSKSAALNERYYSEPLQKKLLNAVVIYVGQPWSYVNNVLKLIDEENPSVTPQIVDGRTLVPVRFIAESSGAKVGWNSETSQVTVSGGGVDIKLTLGQKEMLVNGKSVKLDVAAQTIQDRTMLPLRSVIEALNKQLFWDDRGIIVVSGIKNMFDSQKDGAFLDELWKVRFGMNLSVDKTEIKDGGYADDYEQRIAAFKNRNSAEETKILADEFFAMIDLELPVLADVKEKYNLGDHSGALEAYHAFFMDWVKTLPKEYDLPFEKGSPNNQAADFLMNNTFLRGNQALFLGEPGGINWEHNKKQSSFSSEYFNSSNPMYQLYQFNGLFDRYMNTGNASLIMKWSEYIDDWCINERGYRELNPAEVGDNMRGTGVVADQIFQIKTAVNKYPATEHALPANTLARFLAKMVIEYPPVWITYMRSNPQNWSTQLASDTEVTGLILKQIGFKCAQYLIDAGRLRVESLSTVHGLKDGTDHEQNLHYDMEHLVHSIGETYTIYDTVLKGYMPDWWMNIQKDNMMRRGNFLLHMLTVEGRYPSGCRIDLRQFKGDVVKLLQQRVPELLEKPENEALLAAIPNGEAEPPFKSEWFPYGGFYNLREGWKKDSQYAFMFGSPHPANYDFRVSKGNNVLALSAFGRDMLVHGEVGNYDTVQSPVLVDGQEQNYNAGIGTWGHRHFMTTGWDNPADLRWHTSENYDFAESVYSGKFGKQNAEAASESNLVKEIDPEQYNSVYGDAIVDISFEAQQKEALNVLNSVVHTRQVGFARGAGLWIVTDRMASNDEHTYTQKWKLPVTPGGPRRQGGYKLFDPDDIVVDKEASAVRTQQKSEANISIYSFCTSPVTIESRTQNIPESNSYKISNFQNVLATFSGDGEQILVSAIYPRQTLGDELKSIEPLSAGPGTAGFKAGLKNGSHISYIAGSSAGTSMSIEGISAECESLTVTKNAAGKLSGVVMGCKRFSFNGQAINSEADFEFNFESGINIVPIYRPIAEVEISPGVSAFDSELQIELSTPTEGTTIRYTVDGSEPTVKSPVYNRPFAIRETTLVKAKAYRKGVKDEVLTQSGTLATPVSRAIYIKTPIKEATDAIVEDGLDFDYYEGNWKEFMVNLDSFKPLFSGKTESLFDTSPRRTDDTYAFRYKGYLDIPQDGAYNFYAPDEWLKPNVMEGYEIILKIDGETWRPTVDWHNFGAWSVPLAQGLHKFEVVFIDFRCGFPQKYNKPNLTEFIFSGTPKIEFSGPDIERQSLPNGILKRNAE